MVFGDFHSLVFIIFAFSFTKPQTPRDWRSFGALSAFIVALFTEMCGFPLTIYLLSGWLQARYPGTDLMSHDAGHLWPTLFGFKGNPHFGPLHIASDALILMGFILLSAAWNVLSRRSAGMLSLQPAPTPTSAIRSMSASSSSCLASCCSGRLFSRC